MFATRTKNEQSASSNTVNFIDPIPAYAGMTRVFKFYFFVTPAQAGVGPYSVRNANQKRTKCKFEYCKFYRPYPGLRRDDKKEKNSVILWPKSRHKRMTTGPRSLFFFVIARVYNARGDPLNNKAK